MLKVAFGTVGVLAMAVLAGCAGGPSGASVAPEVQYTYQDPETVPREQWSQAMVIAREGLGLHGLVDAVAPDGVTVSPRGQANFNGADNLATGVLGAASPSTHISGGASLALGAGLFLLGGGTSPPTAFSQIAFWVPADMVSNAEEASLVAAKTYQEMRHKAFNPPSNNDLRATAKYPRGHRNAYATPMDNFHKRPVPFDGEAEYAQFGEISGEFFGPIYITFFQQDVFVDGRRNKLERSEVMERLADVMPEWSAAYLSGGLQNDPLAVIHGKKINYFVVGKE